MLYTIYTIIFHLEDKINQTTTWFVYLIQTLKGKLYCGITIDLERRFNQHLTHKGAKFFYSDTPIKIVYTEILRTRSEALKREAAIKKLTKIQKQALVNQSK